MTDLGKIEDAGQVVKGGGIDRHWKQISIEQSFLSHFKETPNNHHWLFDSEACLTHFNLRSIEFGNWMSQQDRANFLYATALSLHHLAVLFKIKDSDIGLGGRLSLALGARGHGRASGHYEPSPFSVINLTKTQGMSGVLAHEYAHALDNLISYVSSKQKQQFASGGRTTRKDYNGEIAKKGNFFQQQFEDFFNRLYFDSKGNPTPFHNHLKETSEYWNRRSEVFARSFEVYIHMFLSAKKIKNTFLVSQSYQSPLYPTKTLIRSVMPIIDAIVFNGLDAIYNEKESLSGINTDVGYKGFRKTIKENASLEDTLKAMKRIVLRDYKQVAQLAHELEGNSVGQTCNNIWNYLRANTRYKLDREGLEELRTPSRGLVDGYKGLQNDHYGIDCDDYTILISALLLNLNIAHEYRIVAYHKKGKFQHIYPVAFDDLKTPFVIDAVPEIPHFNYEQQPIIDLKTVPMELHELSGVEDTFYQDTPITAQEIREDIASELNSPYQLEGIENEYEDAILEDHFLSGFKEVYDQDKADIILHGSSDAIKLLERGILAEVNKARKTLKEEQQRPTILSELINVSKELHFVERLMRHWEDHSEREEVLLSAIANNSSYSNFYKAIKQSLEDLQQEGLEGIDTDTFDTPLYLSNVTTPDLLADVLEDEEEEDFELQGFEDTTETDEDFGQDEDQQEDEDPFWEEEDELFEEDTPALHGFFRKVFRKIRRGVKKAVKAVVRFNPATLAMRGAIILILKTNMFKFSEKLIYGYLTQKQARAKRLNLHEWRKLVDRKNKAERFFKKIGGRASKFRKAVVRGRARKKTGIRLSGMGAVATAPTAAASGFIVFMKKILRSINPARLFKKVARKIRQKKQTNRRLAVRNTRKPAPSTRAAVRSPRNTTTAYNNSPIEPYKPTGFLDKVKDFFSIHKKKVIIAGVGSVLAIIAVIFYNKNEKKKKRSLAGIKAARTRARNRKRLLATAKIRRPAIKRKTASRPRAALRGVKKASPQLKGATRKTTNASRLKAMHRKAKELQKKHPKTKYSTLLKRAAATL